MGPTTPAHLRTPVWAVPVSLATTQGITIVFSSSGYLDVSVPRVSFPIKSGYLDMTPGGLPHSEIHGSAPVCGSPWLIAAYHVLLRLFVPRHPPYALGNFAVLFFDLSCCGRPPPKRSAHASPATLPPRASSIPQHRECSADCRRHDSVMLPFYCLIFFHRAPTRLPLALRSSSAII